MSVQTVSPQNIHTPADSPATKVFDWEFSLIGHLTEGRRIMPQPATSAVSKARKWISFANLSKATQLILSGFYSSVPRASRTAVFDEDQMNSSGTYHGLTRMR